MTGKSGHASTCSGGYDDVISSAGAGGGALLRSTVPARGPGPGSGHAWARPGSAIKPRARRRSGRTDESDR